jgi:hypothetical protein
VARLERLAMIQPPLPPPENEPPHVTFVEPRRECDERRHGLRCGAHVIKFATGAWWCPLCSAVRTLANTSEVRT